MINTAIKSERARRPRRVPAGRSVPPVEKRWGLIFVLPAAIFFAVFMIFPTFNAFHLSLYRYDLFTQRVFVGLSNYINLFVDSSFWNSFAITVIYVFGTAFAIMTISLTCALVLNGAVAGRSAYRTVLYLPSVMSQVAIAIIFAGVFNSAGLVNGLLRLVGVGTRIYWLASHPHALLGIMITRVWTTFGYYMVIYLAGLQNIPQEYHDAATVDGVNWWARFRYITWPLLGPSTVVVALVAVVNAFQSFTVPYIMTQGGPAQTTRILPIMLYEVGFRYFKMGQASAISVVVFAVIAGFAIAQFRLSNKAY